MNNCIKELENAFESYNNTMEKYFRTDINEDNMEEIDLEAYGFDTDEFLEFLQVFHGNEENEELQQMFRDKMEEFNEAFGEEGKKITIKVTESPEGIECSVYLSENTEKDDEEKKSQKEFAIEKANEDIENIVYCIKKCIKENATIYLPVVPITTVEEEHKNDILSLMPLFAKRVRLFGYIAYTSFENAEKERNMVIRYPLITLLTEFYKSSDYVSIEFNIHTEGGSYILDRDLVEAIFEELEDAA